MGMVVRTNTMALNAYRQLGMNNSAVAKSLEKLSSGFRINRAGDDAAGLAISEKMKAQITGLETASANAQDGISLIQTAEGNLNEVHDMLNRMVELATKSANGTYTITERQALQDEVDQLLEEIDRISQSANFNGTKLLDGSLTPGGGGQTINGIDRIIDSVYTAADGEPAALSGTKTFLDGAGTTATKTEFLVDFTGLKGAANAAATKGTPAVYESAEIKAADLADVTAPTTIAGINVDLSKATDANKMETIETALKGDTTFAGKWDIARDATTGEITLTSKTPGAVATANVPADFTEAVKGVDGVTAAKAQGSVKLTQTGDTITIDGTTIAFDSAAVVGTATDTDGGKYQYTVAGDSTNGWTISVTAKADGAAGNAEITGTVGGSNTAKLTIAGGVDAVTETTAKYTLAADDVALAGKQLTVGGQAYNVTGADLKAQIQSWTEAYNKDAANTDWTASVGEDGTTVLYTAKTPGATAPTAPTGATEKTPGTDAAAAPTEIEFSFKIGGEADVTSIKVAYGADAKAIAAAVAAKLTDTYTLNGADWTVKDNGDGTLSFALKDDPTANNIKGDFDWDVTTTTPGTMVGNHTAGTVVTKPGAIDGASSVANTVFNITAADIKDGTKITIDGVSVTLAVGKKSSVDASGKGVIDLTHMDADNIDLDDALSRISEGFKGYTTNFIVGVNDATNPDAHQGLTVHKKAGSTQVYDTKEKLADVFSLRTGGTGKALTLQIGDTADSFNKMSVAVEDMSTSGLGLAKLDITTEENASDAINRIKTAINTVSTARAGMGALQNRLEHTINNLDVAVENLSSANSRIRDTDMAKEMMNYTKMNVLVQSAQAMLAQANQQPQSVLQLLQ